MRIELGMRIEFYPDNQGEWRWRAVAANGNTIADSAEGYANRVDCEGGLVALATALRLHATQVVEINADGGRAEGYLHALMDQAQKRRRPVESAARASMTDGLAAEMGFASAAELVKLVASVDLTAPGALVRFERWKSEDGTKAGLLAAFPGIEPEA